MLFEEINRHKHSQGYGIAFLVIFLFSTIIVALTLRMMTNSSLPNTLIAYQDRFNAETITTIAFEQVREDILSKLNAGTTVDINYTYPSPVTPPANATTPHDPNNLTGAQDTIGTWYATLVYQRGNAYMVKVTVSTGGANISKTQLLMLKGTTLGYYRTITIDHTKVPNTDQTNFPMLFSGTYSYLATQANAGKVTNANGYDVTFTSDAAGTQLLKFEQGSYNTTTGQVTYWVKIPTLSHTTDTVIYLQYGNSSITTDQSNKTGVWDSNYLGVWHMNDNAANQTVADSTANSNTGTNVANTSTKTVTGQIGSALNYNGSTDYANTSAIGTIKGQTQVTISAWVKTSIIATGQEDIYFEPINSSNNTTRICLNIYGTTHLFRLMGRTNDGDSLTKFIENNTALSTNTWYYVVAVYDSINDINHLMVNGVDQTNALVEGTFSSTTPFVPPVIATDGSGANPWGNSGPGPNPLDEIRVSKTARSVDWNTTEYNNQSSPSTFYTLGAEVAH